MRDHVLSELCFIRNLESSLIPSNMKYQMNMIVAYVTFPGTPCLQAHEPVGSFVC